MATIVGKGGAAGVGLGDTFDAILQWNYLFYLGRERGGLDP